MYQKGTSSTKPDQSGEDFFRELYLLEAFLHVIVWDTCYVPVRSIARKLVQYL